MSTGIEAFVREYERVIAETKAYSWATLDKHLLAACEADPSHTDVHAVFAKVALVNRVYRTNLRFGGKDAEWRIAEHMTAAALDHAFVGLDGTERFSEATFQSVVKAHQDLLSVVWTATKRTEVSFASKYLHFHFPRLFPIYNSFAVRTAASLAPLPEVAVAITPDLWSRKYEAHCLRVLALVDALQRQGVADPDVKAIDVVLYWRLR